MQETINFPKELTENFLYDFKIDDAGLYLFEIIANAKSWWQNLKKLSAFFDDDDLAVKIDGIEFPKLDGKRGLFDGEAAWNGNNLKGLKKTAVFILNLDKGLHTIEFVADQKPMIHGIEINKVDEAQIEYIPKENNQAEDGNRRQWITIAISDLPLQNLEISAKAEKREKDCDDIKLTIDGEIQQNPDSKYFKNWYWCGSIDDTQVSGAFEAPDTEKETWKIFKKETNLPKGLHYIELWADRMPTLNKVKLVLKLESENKQENNEKIWGKVALYEDMADLDYVNFRSEPIRKPENIIGEIKHGMSVEIIEKEVRKEYVSNLSDIWHKVSYGGNEGFILSSFVEIIGQERSVVVEKIKEKADELGLEQKLMIAIAFQESKFKPYAVSYRGVQGVFQITNDALQDVKEKTGYEVLDRFNFEQSIEAGLRYYKYIILPKFDPDDKQYLEKTIAAYNAGYNKIPRDKDEKLIYKNLVLEEIKKIEVERYTKSILKNYGDKDWIKRLFIPLIILVVLVGLQLFQLKAKHNAVSAEAPLYQNNLNKESDKIIVLYSSDDNIYKSAFTEEVFKIKIEGKESLLRIKENKEDDSFEMFLNNKEILKDHDGLKDISLWNSNILIARFWGGQSIYNHFFDLKNEGAIIPFLSDGKSYDSAGSGGGSGIGEIPPFGEVFILYFKGYDGNCSDLGEIFTLYGDLDGVKLLKIWNMKQSEDWCDNFHG